MVDIADGRRWLSVENEKKPHSVRAEWGFCFRNTALMSAHR